MSLVVIQAAANQSPDPGQGGSAVTGNVNTGHGSTTSSGPIGSGQTKTCIWTGFGAVTGQVVSVRLKFDWTEDGLVGTDATNVFQVQYSVNGGGAWTNVFVHIDVTSPTSSSSNILLPTADPTQVQVRDLIQAIGSDVGIATVTASVSNIQLEVMIADPQVIVIM
jgi:hypothetical protein